MQECPNRVGRGIGIAIDVCIPNTCYPIAFRPEMRISLGIMHQSMILTVLAAVDFDN
jgi:hypothetical protein